MKPLRVIQLLSTSLLAISMAGVSVAAETTTPAGRPNILLILTDDMGYGDITANGKGIGVPTPNIDSLAAQGLRFTQFYVGTSICSPSRATILTGRFPGEVRITTFLHQREANRVWDQDDWLDPKEPTLPRALKAAGYKTAHVGKWHLGGGRDVTTAPKIREYGYDEALAATYESPEPDPKLGRRVTPWSKELEPGQVPRYERTAYMVDRAVDFIKRQKNDPWFVAFWPDDVHTPWRPSPEMRQKYGIDGRTNEETLKELQAVLEEYDKQVGRLVKEIDQLGLGSNTIVIFTSDNGPAPGFDRLRAGGLRGTKATLYEGGIREPFIVRWPGHAPAGQTDDQSLIHSVDFFPTLCAIAGAKIDPQAQANLDGQDISAAFNGKPITRSKPLFWEFGRARPKVGRNRDRGPQLAVREGNLKVLVNPDGSDREVYDVKADPNETKNLNADPGVAAKAAELEKAVIEWRKSLPHRVER